ncbi:hypothetical protein BGZ70_008881 [Mortierella alpina]|uniref:Pentatricopeptide repeat-containing protein n=1 Tax=Mortierella alpina TaxID=64518 RepID=A0A9P6J2W5_MORAP|nr:hypothetical protein BGZ70_008881 [Mortierella alpina]
MAKLDRALQDNDLRTALDIYLLLKRRTFEPQLFRTWFHIQRRLVRLFHQAQLERMAANPGHLQTPQSARDEWNRKRVLRHIAQRTLKGNEHAESLAALVDAIGRSKAIVHHSYETKSTTKLQDWRDALRVLEEWASSPASWRRATGNDAIIPKGPAEANTSTSGCLWRLTTLEHDLSHWLTKLMKKLVFSHTFLIRSMLDSIPQQFGIRTTAAMHVVLLDYYATLGHSGFKESMAIVEHMTQENIPWKQEPVVYDYLLHALSHMSGNEAQANRIIEQMLASDLIPRGETMKAAIMCAARAGDLEACSRYIKRMHQEWNLTVTERMKAILLYACAKRGDFDSALEILSQLSHTGTLVHPKTQIGTHSRRPALQGKPGKSASIAVMEPILSTLDIVNNSNILLALINETHAKRGKKELVTQKFVKEEVSRVLELFTVITKDPNQVDTQLYTIMMQYLSTLPSPLPGMLYLYNEMRASTNAQPNKVTYRIMLEACAEQMDMDQGEQLWSDMVGAGILEDCHVRSSFVKGWGRVGSLDLAEQYTREGLLAQKAFDRQQQQQQQKQYQHMAASMADRESSRWTPMILKAGQQLEQPPASEMISLTVLHELMKANWTHNRPERVLELYQEMDKGQWGLRIRPNQFSVSIVLQACGSGTASESLVDQSIDLVEGYLDKQRRLYHQQPQHQEFDDSNEDDALDGQDTMDDMPSQRHPLPLTTAVAGKTLPILSDLNYRLYYTMLGRHHRQRKMIVVWDDMMDTIERPPSRRVVNLVTEALENVQWGAGPIKRIQRELREKWPKVEWQGSRRSRPQDGGFDVDAEYEADERDDSVGAGGRFWK